MPSTDFIDNNIFNTDEVENSVFNVHDYVKNILDEVIDNVVNLNTHTNKYEDIEQFIENENNTPQENLLTPQLETLDAKKILYLIDKELLNNYLDSSFITNFYSIVCALENIQETDQLISYYHSKKNTPKSINEVKNIISTYKNNSDFISKGIIYLENKIKKEQPTKYKTYRDFVKNTEQQERNASDKRKKELKQQEKDDIEQKRLKLKKQKEEQESAEKAFKEQEKLQKQTQKQQTEQEKQQQREQERLLKEQQKQQTEQEKQEQREQEKLQKQIQKQQADEQKRLQREQEKLQKELQRLQEQQDKETQKIQEKEDKKRQKEEQLETELLGKIVCKTDLDVATHVLTIFKGKIFYIKGKIYLKKKNIYTENNAEIETELANFIMNSECAYVTNDCIIYKWRNYHHIQEALKTTLIKLKEHNSDNLYEKFHTTTKSKLCFLDGVFDLSSSKFYKWDEITFEYYSTMQLQYNFLDVIDNVKDQTDLTNLALEPLFTEHTGLFLQAISRILAGHKEDKFWLSYTGNRDCGKGIIYEILKYTFECYVEPMPTNNLLKSKSSHSTTIQTSRDMYWMMDYEYPRLALCQETPPKDDNEKCNVVINSKLLKTIHSGGDYITARRNYDKVDTKFLSDTTVMILGNSYLDGDENDINEKRIDFTSSVQFKTQTEIDKKHTEHIDSGMTKKDTDEIIKKRYRLSIPTLKDDIKVNKNRDAMLMLIIKNYKKEKVNNTTQSITEHDDENTSIIVDLYKLFDFTKISTDCVLKSLVKQELKQHAIKKIDIELKGLGISSIKSKQGVTRDKVVYVGIKFKSCYADKATETTDEK